MRNLLVLTLFFSVKLFSQDISDGLLLEYSFDNNFNDVSGNDFHATNFGAVFIEDRNGNPGSALYFDGVDDYINFPNIEELKPNLPISFSFWVRYDSDNANDRDLFNTSFEEDRNTGVFFNSQQSTGNYAVNFGDGSTSYVSSTRRTFVANEPIETNVWHHIAVIVNSENDMKIYVDCFDVGGDYSGTGGSLEYSNLPGSLGRHDRDLNASANYFKGAIDDFKYWNRELTEDEVNELCMLSIPQYNLIETITIYPNPTSGELNVVTDTIDFDYIKIYNGVGQRIFYQKFSKTVNIKSLPKGIYYLNLIKDSNIEVRKIVKQ